MIVSPSLVKRCKNHFHNLLCEASIILGNNGYIWISPLVKENFSRDVLRFQVPSAPGTSSVEKQPRYVTTGTSLIMYTYKMCAK